MNHDVSTLVSAFSPKTSHWLKTSQRKAWQEALWKYPYQTPVPSWPLQTFVVSDGEWENYTWHDMSPHLLNPPRKKAKLSPPNIVSKSWKCIATVALPRRISVTSPPFQEVLARSVRALMPFAAMMRSFFCICRLKRLTRWHFCFLENFHWSYD